LLRSTLRRIAGTTVLTLAIAVAVAGVAYGGSFGQVPPKAALMKDATVLQKTHATGGNWVFCHESGECGYAIYDNFGEFDFPEADYVNAGSRLHVRLDKPERPNFVEVNAFPAVKEGQLGGEYVAGQKQLLVSTLKPVKRDGKVAKWDVFFRTNEPNRDYYLRVSVGWGKPPDSHASYGRTMYAFHVKTR
jgi:hypothetical protein